MKIQLLTIDLTRFFLPLFLGRTSFVRSCNFKECPLKCLLLRYMYICMYYAYQGERERDNVSIFSVYGCHGKKNMNTSELLLIVNLFFHQKRDRMGTCFDRLEMECIVKLLIVFNADDDDTFFWWTKQLYAVYSSSYGYSCFFSERGSNMVITGY